MLTNQETTVPENIKTVVEIQEWLVNYLAEFLEVETEEIDINRSFDEYALNSSTVIYLTGELEEWLGSELEPTLLYEYSTIHEVTLYLSSKTSIS